MPRMIERLNPLTSEQTRTWEHDLRRALSNARLVFDHATVKGNAIESMVRALLRAVTDPRRGVSSGQIRDSYDKLSAQVDVAITHEFHPPSCIGDQTLFLVEGVAVVGEIKSQLTSDHLDATVANGQRLRELRVEFPDRTVVHASPSDVQRFAERPPFFLFAMESQLSLTTVLERVRAAPSRSVDAVFLLDRGYLIDFGDGRGSFRFLQRGDHRSLPGWQGKADPSDVLDAFLDWVIAMTMPVRVPVNPADLHPRYIAIMAAVRGYPDDSPNSPLARGEARS